MFKHIQSQILSSGQSVLQVENLSGVYKGIVEDVGDPFHLGRVRVRVYSIHGDYKETPTESLSWAECSHPLKGSYSPPEKFDRVWVMFENGDKNTPIWVGYWYAIPAGRGKLSHNSVTGSEVPQDYWKFHSDDYPQTLGVARSHEGNGIWFDDQHFGGNYYGTITVETAGGSYLRIRSKIPNQTDSRPSGSGNPDLGGWNPRVSHRYIDTSGVSSKITESEYIYGTSTYQFRSYTNKTSSVVENVVYKDSISSTKFVGSSLYVMSVGKSNLSTVTVSDTLNLSSSDIIGISSRLLSPPPKW